MAIGDFETQKKNLQEKIVSAEDEAQITMDMTEVEKLNNQLAQLEATKHEYEDVAKNAEEVPEAQLKQVTDLGGSGEVLEEKLAEKNDEVEQVEVNLEQKVPNGDIEHKVNEGLELGSTNEEVVENTEVQGAVEFYKKWDGERIKNKIDELGSQIKKFESKINDLDNMSPVDRSQKVSSNPFGNFEATRGELIPRFKEENQKMVDSRNQEIAVLEEVLKEKSEEAVEKNKDSSGEIKESVEQIDGHKNNTGLENQLQSLADKEDRFKRVLNLQNQFLSERMAEYKNFKDAGGDKGSTDAFINQGYFDRELNSLNNKIDLYERGLSEINKVRQEAASRIAKGETDNQVYSEFLDRYHSL